MKGTTLKTPFHIALSNKIQITLHFFQGRISAMPEIRADLFLAISRLECVCSLRHFLKRFTIIVSSWPRFEKKLVLVLVFKLVKISYDSD